MEERRKILTKSYFPSMSTQYGNYGDHIFGHRNVDSIAPVTATYRDQMGTNLMSPYNMSSGQSIEHEGIQLTQASTPFSNKGNVELGLTVTIVIFQF